MIIKGGEVFCPDGSFRNLDILIDNNNTIAAVGADLSSANPDEPVTDAGGKYVLPGLLDVHTHGAVGCDFCDASPNAIREFARYERNCGVTGFCPTSMTYPEEKLTGIFRSAGEVPDDKEHAFVAGINMEGPFISPHKVGAQNPKYVQKPDIAMFERLAEAAGAPISLVTLAPEVDGAAEFIEALSEKVHISLGHSSTEYAYAASAFESGADHVTHLYNAMPPYRHREPGLIGAASDAVSGHLNTPHDCYIELIADGIHSHPSAVRGAFRQFGAEHMVLISDSMRATGMADGESELGGQLVIKRGAEARLENGSLAGSVTNLMDCMRNVIKFGIKPEHAIMACTVNPAKSIGLEDKIGVITPGARADILIMNREWELEKII